MPLASDQRVIHDRENQRSASDADDLSAADNSVGNRDLVNIQGRIHPGIGARRDPS